MNSSVLMVNKNYFLSEFDFRKKTGKMTNEFES